MDQGQNRILTLYNILLSENRMEDMRRATEDADYRNRLFEELDIPDPSAALLQ